MVELNPESAFAEGGRSDGVRLQKEFRTVVPTGASKGHCALHGIFSKYASALTAAAGDPATQTVNEAITYLETQSQVDAVIAEW